MNTRLTASDLRDTDEGGGHNINDHRPELINHRMSQEPAAAVENIPARPIQIARSAEKNLPTKIALRFLQSVKIEDLAEKDRSKSAAKTIISLPPRPSRVVFAS